MNQSRAFFDAVTLDGLSAPYNTANLKIYYPAQYGASAEENNSGVIPPCEDNSPFPIVIMMPGINVETAGYSWLAKALNSQGYVVVTYQLIAQEMPGYISLTPGLDIQALTPDNFAKTPSSTALSGIIERLEQLNQEGLLAGKLATDKIILGGHSAGGTTAMLNANPLWFKNVCASFSYGAHSGASTLLGWSADTLLPLPSQVPTLILGGTQDGCIANSAHRYESSDSTAQATTDPATDRVRRTFHEALTRNKGDSALVLFAGGNHFSFVTPNDQTTGRPFIDMDATCDEDQLRQLMAELISKFIKHCVQALNSNNENLETILSGHYSNHPLVDTLQIK